MKTLWVKEKMLVDSIFSFSHNASPQRPVPQSCENQGLFWKELTEKLKFVLNSVGKKLWEKKKMLVTSISSFSHNGFIPATTKWRGVYWNCHGCPSICLSIHLSVDTILSRAFLLQFCTYCSEIYT